MRSTFSPAGVRLGELPIAPTADSALARKASTLSSVRSWFDLCAEVPIVVTSRCEPQ
ncbi:hypothetical protein D9M69_705470 [compost metagenome]